MNVAVGILSTAHPHATGYIDALEDIPDAECVAVADENRERGQAIADGHGVPLVEPAEICAAIDVGILCARPGAHRNWVQRAADAGVDVLCEPPLALSTTDAEAIIQACGQANIRLGMAMPLRHNQPAIAAKAVCREGTLGDLKAIRGTNVFRRPGVGSGEHVPPNAPGSMAEATVHVLDLIRWIVDDRILDVYVETGAQFDKRPAPDTALLSMTLTHGTPVTLEGSWRHPEAWPAAETATVRLVGTDGVLDLDCFDQTVTFGDQTDVRSVYWGDDQHAAMVQEFLTAVHEDGNTSISAQEGLATVRLIEAAESSARQNKPVSVPELPE